MAEKESLERQIKFLGDLINEHKRVHGDGQFPSAVQRHPHAPTSARGRGSSTYFNSYNPRGRHYAPAPATAPAPAPVPEYAGSWKKTHFLRNKNPQSSTGGPSAPASSSMVQSSIQPASRSISLPISSRGEGGDGNKTAALPSAFAQQKKEGHTSSITGIEKDPAKVRPINSSTSAGPSSQHKQTSNPELPPSPVLKGAKQASLATTSLTSKAPATKSFPKKSKFTWVKSQNVGGELESKPGTSVSPPMEQTVGVSPTSAPKAAVASGSSSTVAKKTPAKKLPRKLSPAAASSKTSKYKWVSSSSSSPGAQAKLTSQKSPEALLLLQRACETGEATKRLRADRSHRGVRGGLFFSPSRTSPPSSSPGGFKLRSRMKIIRKSANSGGGSERGSSPSAVKNFPQGRMHTSTRTPPGVRKTTSRDLVPFGRHKLRRLSPASPRAGPASSSQCSPASQRVFKTRYNIVTRPGSSASHAHHYGHSHTHSWKVKRVQAARSFHQSRPRSAHDRHPSPTQHWRGSDMCWIGDSLYRVSPNKLSRTSPTGRSPSPNVVSPVTPSWNRPSSTRHLASRAVQRSLATIRQAHQKKQQKQYCMYYNRFGKCNRGDSCPYIHDPDKVAVCTRFLRGTCKQADGTCPFSHQVAKEKMPVCSYFLKGICNNSDCPYSHVYVSHKAKVCEDFVKGYCPEGEKCKKKHTLVCPDFSKTGSCPNGSRCKLKHRQNAKRSSSSSSSSHTTKRARTETETVVQRPQAEFVTPTHGPLTLPSFISLSCSPEEPETSETQPAKVKAKGLQIKPRLKTAESSSSSSSSSSSGAPGLS